MFNGVPQEQFPQFIASSTAVPPSSLPINPFDSYPRHVFHQLHQNSVLPLNKDEQRRDKVTINSGQSERNIDPWSNDEVLSLLRIRSSLETWFPDLTWEHVSRKLAEFGFRRSAEKCKEKFEEETSNFNNISFNKNRFFSEFEELCHGEKTQKPNEEEDKVGRQSHVEEEDDTARDATVVANNNPTEEQSDQVVKNTTSTKEINKKRKKGKKFEMLKGFCVDFVNKMMAYQEMMHNKLLEDMVNRDERKIAREEAWKKQEMESFNTEIEIRAQEQAISCTRQATIIEFMKKFTSNSSKNKQFEILIDYEDLQKISNTLSSTTSPSFLQPQNIVSPETYSTSTPSSTSTLPLTSENRTLSEKRPSEFPPSRAKKAKKNPDSVTYEKDDFSKRWPRDEVLALINMRCSIYNNNNDQQEKEIGGTKGSLWERISQGMLEMGYKRSAKRCKEKWENINKYFRKTKDVNKKRSVDSRTCPYFHQLSSLYNKGVPEGASDGPENRPAVPKTGTTVPGTSFRSDQNVDADGGNNVIQGPAFNFEF